MKLSTKIILPIILISALLILLAGCFGVPADEEPGVTEVGAGTITGIIAAPCCNTSGEPVSEDSGSPEYWCYWCEKDWYLQEGIEVILTSGQVEIATTTTDEFGEYIFTDVPPGENYVITAYCPDKEIPLVMDVVPEIIEGGEPFDAGTTDLVSTSLGLVVDYVTYFAAWDPEDISLDKVMAAKPDFEGFPKFRKLIREVRRVLENCEDVDADDKLLDVLCKAAEEVSESDMGCAPGYTPEVVEEAEPGPGPTPPVTYTLTATANPPEGGTVSGGGTYNSGTVVTVTATPADNGWYFDEWTGDASGTNSTTSVTMDANKAVIAHFIEEGEPDTYTLTIDYEYGDGSTAATSYVDAAMNVGDPYSVLSPVIAGGYTADQLTVSGTMPADDVTVLVVYTCDPCSGWEATDVTVIIWQAGSGNSDPRLDIDGTITGPSCAGIIEIDIELELYNSGGHLQESFTDTLTSVTNTFTVDLDVPSAFYNSITDYKLWITVPGCSSVLLIKEGPVVE